MLYTTSVMANQIGECSLNNRVPFKHAFNVNAVKKEECKDEDFIDDTVEIYETAIIPEVQGNLICDEMKQYDTSTILDNIKMELPLSEVQYDIVHDNPKIEGISVDDIKIEFNNGLLYCEDCQVYREDYCTKCEMLVHILNKTILINVDSKLQETLPNNILEINDYFGNYHVFALKVIPEGVRFGPFTGINTASHPWRIKGGKFIVNKDKSKYLNWMQYINPARNVSEQNLQIFQYEHNLYYESTRRIEDGDELLVHFGEEYEDSLNRNIEVDFIPPSEHIFKNSYACTFCCYGFSSKSYLAKHKSVCPGNADGEFSIEELVQCPSCQIHLDGKEYITHHMAYCCEEDDRKWIPTTIDDRLAQVNRRKTRQYQKYKCPQCKYITNYTGDLKNHTNQHYELKMHKCGVCCRRYKTKEVLKLHVENTHICDNGKDDLERSTEVYVKAHVKAEHSCRRVQSRHLNEPKHKCDRCDYKANRRLSLKIHIDTIHLKVFKYKCDTCDYKTNRKADLKSHIEIRHSKEFKYKCDSCDYKTNWKHALTGHMETRHLKEFKYKCDTCNYKTNWKNALKGHIGTRHLKEYKYKCDRCDYKANRKDVLKRHIETIHLKEFKYKCDTCEYKTYSKTNLKAHIESKHLKEVKYKCDKCYYKTYSNAHLKRHTDTKHLKEFKCKYYACDYKASNKSNLAVHVKSKHLK